MPCFLADLDCDGIATPGILDTSGDLWVVDHWPEGNEVEARFVASIDGARRVDVEREGSCDVLAVTTPDGVVRPRA